MSSSEISESKLYQPLTAAEHGLGPDSGGARKNKTRLESYLRRTLPERSLVELPNLKHKRFFLESGAKRPYNRQPGKRKTLTVRERKSLNLFKVDSSEVLYELYLPLHELWKDYIRDFINLDQVTEKSRRGAELRLLRADYHGCRLLVVRAKNPSLVGLAGIVLQETKHTFRVVTKDDKIKTIPKLNCVFTVTIDDHVLTIYGNNFQFKSSERASRNFKTRYSIDF